ncbi:TIGR00341 family protein [Lutimonas zeaxanthinifaciens]|uniref:TIGR00341 family protein n=1 Tax=Lutimonas zeaxanthinifaciens TaxID=3060215 RepID=UPI00265C9B76|nr:TIGR00341 family protein [Lutimonas sp. YSD2104]WKK65138.1 TIGR00341 family protein [Lutimonas sp. YSD2104]
MEEKKQDNLEEDKKFQEQKEEVQKEFKGFFQSLKEYIPQLLNIKRDTDKEATARTIREGISIKGQTAWILVFSILIASIGLNVSSTAVVIGAMLISPLMGPILGIGFSIGVNDVDTLKASVINFGAMVFLSILTSFIFFSIPIFKEATPEILARTKPDVRDVLIAMAGGLALIIAISRNKPQFNTVAGVAIATALMPPLCTAGFGLATGQFNYFGGAMFLFTINCIYIALAAFAITKYLKFPMRKYINQAKRKRISRIASLIAFVILAFSIYLFYQLYLINNYTIRAEKFIEDLKEEGVNIIGDNSESINFQEKEIKLYVFGNDYSVRDKERWEEHMEDLGLRNTKLTILKSQDDSGIREDIDQIKELYINSHQMLSSRDETIKEKDLRISELEKDLRRYYANEVQFNRVIEEIRINYSDLQEIRFAREFASNFEKIDTLNIVSVKWKNKVNNRKRKQQEKQLQEWLKARLNLKQLEVRQLK